MKSVDAWNQARNDENKEQKMLERGTSAQGQAQRFQATHRCEEICCEQTALDNLADKLARRLRPCSASETSVPPPTGPPRAIAFVVLKLAREEHRDEDLEYRTLDRDRGNHSQHSMRDVPPLEHEQELEEGDHANDAADVGDTGHD